MGLIYDFTGKTLVQHVREGLYSAWNPSFISANQADELREWRIGIGLLSVLYVLILFIPQDVLTRFPEAREFTDFMSGLIPSIDAIAKRSLIPEFSRFVYSFLWAFMPIPALAFAIKVHIYQKNGWGRSIIYCAKGRVIKGIFAILAMSLLFFPNYWDTVLAFPDERLGRVGTRLLGTKSGIAFYAPISVSGFYYFFIAALMFIKGLLTGEILNCTPEKDKETGGDK